MEILDQRPSHFWVDGIAFPRGEPAQLRLVAKDGSISLWPLLPELRQRASLRTFPAFSLDGRRRDGWRQFREVFVVRPDSLTVNPEFSTKTLHGAEMPVSRNPVLSQTENGRSLHISALTLIQLTMLSSQLTARLIFSMYGLERYARVLQESETFTLQTLFPKSPPLSSPDIQVFCHYLTQDNGQLHTYNVWQDLLLARPLRMPATDALPEALILKLAGITDGENYYVQSAAPLYSNFLDLKCTRLIAPWRGDRGNERVLAIARFSSKQGTARTDWVHPAAFVDNLLIRPLHEMPDIHANKTEEECHGDSWHPPGSAYDDIYSGQVQPRNSKARTLVDW